MRMPLLTKRFVHCGHYEAATVDVCEVTVAARCGPLIEVCVVDLFKTPNGHEVTPQTRGRPYSITSSARASSVGGTSRPRALAVLRLITSSYLVGACTGRSAGFSPLRMRST
jgi:hypothetical protein